MQGMDLFEYAVIRVVPCVEREEFLNVGVILYCQSQGFLQIEYELNKERLKVFSPDTDLEEIEERLLAFKKVCAGKSEGGTIGKLPISGRFRWLTATRSTVVQTSKVHPGLCVSAKETLENLFLKLVQA
jgi:hypothetical protein